MFLLLTWSACALAKDAEALWVVKEGFYSMVAKPNMSIISYNTLLHDLINQGNQNSMSEIELKGH